jgi:hypothetical protein
MNYKIFLDEWELVPGKDELSFVESLFELFFTKQAVVLLAQADRWQGGAKSHILEQAIKRFGEKNVLHLVPLSVKPLT